MIPGIVAKLSRAAVTAATTIGPINADYVRVSGSTVIATIKPPLNGGFTAMLLVSPATNVATTTSGNIAVEVTMAADRLTLLVYDKVTAKWYPGAIS
jgi:hypothetical protein